MEGEGPWRGYEVGYDYLRGNLVTGWETYGPSEFRPDISMGFTGDISRSVAEAIARAFPGAVDNPAAGPGTVQLPVEVSGNEILVSEVIDPSFEEDATVFEEAPGGIFQTNRPTTDWDEVFREYVILNNPEVVIPEVTVPRVLVPTVEPDVIFIPPDIADETGGPPVAVDWGGILGQVAGGLFDPFGMGKATTNFFGPQQAPLALGGGAGVPPKVTVDTRTGKVTTCRRRRRRRLLTSSDLADIAALKAIVGGGAALNSAVVKAVRR